MRRMMTMMMMMMMMLMLIVEVVLLPVPGRLLPQPAGRHPLALVRRRRSVKHLRKGEGCDDDDDEDDDGDDDADDDDADDDDSHADLSSRTSRTLRSSPEA
jgi:hypothetical protein